MLYKPSEDGTVTHAAFVQPYGIARDDVDFIMDTFLNVQCKNDAKRGENRTKWMILQMYDEMWRARETGIVHLGPERVWGASAIHTVPRAE